MEFCRMNLLGTMESVRIDLAILQLWADAFIQNHFEKAKQS